MFVELYQNMLCVFHFFFLVGAPTVAWPWDYQFNGCFASRNLRLFLERSVDVGSEVLYCHYYCVRYRQYNNEYLVPGKYFIRSPILVHHHTWTSAPQHRIMFSSLQRPLACDFQREPKRARLQGRMGQNGVLCVDRVCIEKHYRYHRTIIGGGPAGKYAHIPLPETQQQHANAHCSWICTDRTVIKAKFNPQENRRANGGLDAVNPRRDYNPEASPVDQGFRPIRILLPFCLPIGKLRVPFPLLSLPSILSYRTNVPIPIERSRNRDLSSTL